MAKVKSTNIFKAKFPRIYRFFTDKKLQKALKFQAIVISFALLVALILTFGLDLFQNIQKQKEQNFQREVLTSELKTWESIAQEFPNFKDAYYQLAVLSYRLGDFEKAKEYVKKALFLDPNFDKAKELEKLLSG